MRVRVGLASGEVVVRAVGGDLHADYTAVGQTTHAAAHMRQAASPGTIRLTRPTMDLVEGYVTAKPLADTDVEVELKLEGKAEVAGTVMFSFDLTFAGVFRILNVPQEQVQPIMMIECPRILFPFARRVVADATRDGGFPPLMLDPIDFVELYRRQAQQAQAQQGGPLQA